MSLESIQTPWLIGTMAVSAAIVFWSGARLTRYGDVLAELLGLSKTWIGVILLAFMTSLPEVVVTLTAQLTVARPGLVISNVCGSNLFNLLIFGIVDFYEGPQALSARLDRAIIKPAGFGIVLMLLAIAGFVVPIVDPQGQWFLHGWPISLAIVLVYVYAVKKTEISAAPADIPIEEVAKVPATSGTSVLWTRFFSLGGLLLISGVALIMCSDALIGRPFKIGGWNIVLGESVVGIIGVAIVTSLPELVVSLSAARLGAFDMALGNILGSNIFNVVLLSLAHVIRPLIPFWVSAEPLHAFSLGVSVLLSLIIIAGVRLKYSRGFLRLGWDGLLLVLIAGAAFVVVIKVGTAG